ncbi:MAG: hypothetical protein AB7U05_10525 [Mangrovibacterium sp.]
MLILIGILVALAVAVALATWLSNKYSKKEPEQEQTPAEVPLDCCGAHEVCEFEEMRNTPDKILYFEDEELDRFQGISADQYQDEQIEEFRDVMYTLKSDELKMWLVSIERRNIQLPLILRQEAVQLIAEG